MSTGIFLPGTRGRWVRQRSRIVLLPAEPFRPGWGEGELQGEDPGAVGAQLRIVVFYGYSGAHGAGTTERDLSNQLVARTLKAHLALRFPADQVDVVCAWHKNAFVKEPIAYRRTSPRESRPRGSPGSCRWRWPRRRSERCRPAPPPSSPSDRSSTRKTRPR
jgi:hypothetical protein